MSIDLATSLSSNPNYNFTDIISKLADKSKEPLRQIEKAQEATKTKISTFGTMTKNVEAVQTSAAALATAGSTLAATVTGKGFTVTTTEKAVLNSYKIEVKELAVTHTLKSGAIDSRTDAIGNGGTVKITLENGTSMDVDVSKNTSINGIASAINLAPAGIQAVVLTDENGKCHLLISAKETGAKASLATLEVTGNADLQSVIGFNAAAGASSALSTIDSGKNARLSINGIDVASESNTVSTAIDGITLTLTEVSAGDAATLSLSRDDKAVQTAVESFISSYNTLQKYIKDMSVWDGTKKTGAPLFGDSTGRTVMNKLSAALAGATGSGALKGMSQIGIETDHLTGNLVFTEKVFKEGMARGADSFTSLLSGEAGFGAHFAKATKMILVGDGKNLGGVKVRGILQNRTDTLDRIQKQQSHNYVLAEMRVQESTRTINRQFISLSRMLSSFENTGAYLQEQFRSKSA
jgi:flagellar hook-associated protein 2